MQTSIDDGCNASSVPAYVKAAENKGAAVMAFDLPQRIEAKSFVRPTDAWLRFTNNQGQRPPERLFLLFSISFLHTSWCPGLFMPWADIQGRPLWTPCGENSKANEALATTPLISSVHAVVEQHDGGKCELKGCKQRPSG